MKNLLMKIYLKLVLAALVFSACGSLSFSDQGGSKNESSDDQRLPLDLTTDLPLKAVGRIVAALPNGQYYGCTGSFIARNLVLTAAHCVLNDDGSMRSENVRFFPAVVGTPESFESGVKANYVWRSRQYGRLAGDAKRLVDWAVLRVEGYSDDTLELFSGQLKAGAFLTTISYPVEKSPQGWQPFGEKNCRLNRVSEGDISVAFWSSCDVSEGASGGPVLAYDPETNKFLIVGLIVSKGRPDIGAFHLKSSYLVREISRINH